MSFSSPPTTTASASSCLVLTRAAHRVAQLTMHDNLLGWVQAGRKTLIGSHVHQEYGVGQAFILARGTRWDVVNQPAPGAHYRALVLQFDGALIAQFESRFGAQFADARVAACARLDLTPELQASIQRAVDSLAAPERSDALRQHRLLEVLLLLAEAGILFTPPGALDWGQRARRMLLQRPQAAWTLAMLAHAFHTSASTLRRRLAGCGANFSQLLLEARLETALGLLQTTQLAVGDVAARCGYQSHSRFSAAFRRRFGFAPKQLRPPAG